MGDLLGLFHGGILNRIFPYVAIGYRIHCKKFAIMFAISKQYFWMAIKIMLYFKEI